MKLGVYTLNRIYIYFRLLLFAIVVLMSEVCSWESRDYVNVDLLVFVLGLDL